MAVGQGFVGEGVDAVKPLKLLHCKTAGCVPHSRLGRWLAEWWEKQGKAGKCFLRCVFTYAVP